MVYITANELSEKWNISARRICILCKGGRIPGAVKKGNVWMIPQNAKKPEDGRKTEIKRGINPLCLLFNPTYFDNKSIAPSEDDISLCNIQKKYITGSIKEAYDDIDKAFRRCNDNRYKCVYLFLKFIIGADLGNSESYGVILEMLNLLVNNDHTLKLEKFVMDLYMGKAEGIPDVEISEDEYDELIPLVSAIISKRNINSIMRNQSNPDVSCYEILCHEIEKKDCPLISAYLHMYLAIYYNIAGEEQLFSVHYNKALNILLPRKWHTPLAEYSLTVDLKCIEHIDGDAYESIEKLSETIICSYIKIGLFDRLEYKHKSKYSYNIRVAYKLIQGKSMEAIASELGISQYKVKKQIEEMFSILEINSKKELKEIILKNCLI